VIEISDLNRTDLNRQTLETDLAVIVRSDLKSTSQCNKEAAAAARRITRMVKRKFTTLDAEDFLLIWGHSKITSHGEGAGGYGQV